MPGKGTLADAASLAAADALAARKWEFDSLVRWPAGVCGCFFYVMLLQVAQAAEASRRAEATEKKVAVLTAGFMKRAASLSTQAPSPLLFLTLPPRPSLPLPSFSLSTGKRPRRRVIRQARAARDLQSGQSFYSATILQLIAALAAARGRAAGAAHTHAGASRKDGSAAGKRIRVSSSLFRA